VDIGCGESGATLIKRSGPPTPEVIDMSKLKDQILQLIQKNAARKVATLAGEYCRAKPEEREEIQAGIRFERWLAEACHESLEGQ
jgi:hypothetical protein